MNKKYTRDDLNERQNAWVDRFIELGGARIHATQAAHEIYGVDMKSATVQAYRMLKNEKIQSILVDECVATFAAGAVMATEKVLDIVETGQWHGQAVKPSEGLKALGMLIERGIGPITQIHDHRHNHQVESLNGRELQAAVLQELRKLPDKDRAMMLKQLGGEDMVIDVDAVEIDPDAPWGRKTDGTPKKKPGAKAETPPKHLITSYRKEDKRTDLQKKIDAIKARKKKAKRAEAAGE